MKVMNKITALALSVLMLAQVASISVFADSTVTPVEPKSADISAFDRTGAFADRAYTGQNVNETGTEDDGTAQWWDGSQITLDDGTQTVSCAYFMPKANKPVYVMHGYGRDWNNEANCWCGVDLRNKDLSKLRLELKFHLNFNGTTADKYTDIKFGLAAFTTAGADDNNKQMMMLSLSDCITAGYAEKNGNEYYISVPLSYIKSNGQLINTVGTTNAYHQKIDTESTVIDFNWDTKVWGIAFGTTTNVDENSDCGLYIRHTLPKIVEPMASPAGVSAYFETLTSANLKWNAVDGASKYKISYGSNWAETTETSITLSTEGVSEYKIYAMNSDESIVSDPAKITAAQIAGNDVNLTVVNADQQMTSDWNKNNSWMYRSFSSDGTEYCKFGGEPNAGYILSNTAADGKDIGFYARAVFEFADAEKAISYVDAQNLTLSADLNRFYKDGDTTNVVFGVAMITAEGNRFVLEKNVTSLVPYQWNKFANVKIPLAELLDLNNRAVYESIDTSKTPATLSNTTTVSEADLAASSLLGVVIGTDIRSEGQNTINFKNVNISGSTKKVDASSVKVFESGENTVAVWADVDGAIGYKIAKADGTIVTVTSPVYTGTKDEVVSVRPYFADNKIGSAITVSISNAVETSVNAILTGAKLTGEIGENVSFTANVQSIANTEDVSVILAFYKDNTLENATVQKVTATTTAVPVSSKAIDTTATENGEYTLKVFVWDNDNFAPILTAGVKTPMLSLTVEHTE